ncbi:MAG: CoA:oxalate CoA-transferase [Acidimicrobiales bacterium]|jgi:CoA:oxalate CoA-transferase
MTAPLVGLKVLDLTRVLAGPFAARMLSDLGADVVKVEPPEGDVTRHFGVRRGTQTGYYAQQNAGKRGICVDLTREGGPDLVKLLADQADVVLENFRPGVLANYGLDYASLSTDHPELVMVSISGFGQDGPESQRAAYAGIIHAESGWLHRQSRSAEATPTDSQLSVADTTAGMHGLIGMFAALRVRDATGVGQHVDIAMVEALAVVDDYAHFALDGVADAPHGGGEVWDATGGPLIIMGDFKWVWKCGNEILGLEDPTPPGADLGTKISLRKQKWAEYVLSFDDRNALLAELDRANLAWGSVKKPIDALESPTMAHRGTLTEIDDRHGGTRRVVQPPYKFSKSTAAIQGPAPLRGEHNAAVLSEWTGLGADEIDRLTSDGILLAES